MSYQYVDTVACEANELMTQIFFKDQLTAEHSLEVCHLVNCLYDELPIEYKGSITKQVLINSALLHDIGKLMIPDSILKKPIKLTDCEKEEINKHTSYGKLIMSETNLAYLSEIICYHHERVDGGGYFGLVSDEIPIESKIIAIADTYSALISDRVYRLGCSKKKAIRTLIDVSDTQLDGYLVEVFCYMLEKGKTFYFSSKRLCNNPCVAI